MQILIVISIVWLLGVGLYYLLIYAPIVDMFRRVAKIQTIKKIKKRHHLQAWLWPIFILKIPSLLNEVSLAKASIRIVDSSKKRKYL